MWRKLVLKSGLRLFLLFVFQIWWRGFFVFNVLTVSLVLHTNHVTTLLWPTFSWIHYPVLELGLHVTYTSIATDRFKVRLLKSILWDNSVHAKNIENQKRKGIRNRLYNYKIKIVIFDKNKKKTESEPQRYEFNFVSVIIIWYKNRYPFFIGYKNPY